MNEQTEVYALTNINGRIMCHKERGFMIFLERDDADASVTDKDGEENTLGKKWTVETFVLDKSISSKPFQFFVQHYMSAKSLIKGAMWLNDLRTMVDEGKPIPKKKVKTDIDKIRETIAAKKVKQIEMPEDKKTKEYRPDTYDQVATLRASCKELGINTRRLKDPVKLQALIDAEYETV